jgi:hypothetical protein
MNSVPVILVGLMLLQGCVFRTAKGDCRAVSIIDAALTVLPRSFIFRVLRDGIVDVRRILGRQRPDSSKHSGWVEIQAAKDCLFNIGKRTLETVEGFCHACKLLRAMCGIFICLDGRTHLTMFLNAVRQAILSKGQSGWF